MTTGSSNPLLGPHPQELKAGLKKIFAQPGSHKCHHIQEEEATRVLYNVLYHMGTPLGLQRKGNLTPAPTWTDPENMTLGDISGSQEDKYCATALT